MSKVQLKVETLRAKTTSSFEGDSAGPKNNMIDLKSAVIRLDQRNNQTASSQPKVEFDITFDAVQDKDKLMLEWANCFWTKKQHDSRIIRKVTLYFDYEGEHNELGDKTFEIDKAFLALYEEKECDHGSDDKNIPAVHVVIKASEEDQLVSFRQSSPSFDEEQDKSSED